MHRQLGLLAAAVALLLPAPVYAHGSGMATVLVGFLLGIPAALALLVLIIVSAVAGARERQPRPGWARYGRVTVIVSIVLCVVPIILVALATYFDMGRNTTATRALIHVASAVVVFGGPLLVLATVSVLLARRVVRNRSPGQEGPEPGG